MGTVELRATGKTQGIAMDKIYATIKHYPTHKFDLSNIVATYKEGEWKASLEWELNN